MRLFVAIDLDQAVRQAIHQVQHDIAPRFSGDRRIKWVRPEHMHLTLVFLGEVRDAAAPSLVDALSAPLGAGPVAAALRGFGVFPPHGAPQVLWFGVDEGRDGIVEVHRRVAARLEGLGIERERRPFHPHLTLARWRRPGGSRRALDAVRALAATMPAITVRLDIDHVTLYQSRLSPAGPTYVSLARATLT